MTNTEVSERIQKAMLKMLLTKTSEPMIIENGCLNRAMTGFEIDSSLGYDIIKCQDGDKTVMEIHCQSKNNRCTVAYRVDRKNKIFSFWHIPSWAK